MHPRRLISCLIALALIALGGVSNAQAAEPVTAFKVGQVWGLKGGAFRDARMTVARIETIGDREVLHVSIVDVDVRLPTGATAKRNVGHMPIAADAVRSSVTGLLTEDGSIPSGFATGYEMWRKAPKAGFFTISVQAAVEFAFKASGIELADDNGA